MKLEELKYQFRNESLLSNALTHSSYANQKSGLKSNEKLEFVGDAVLQLIITEYLYNILPGEEEGELTKKRAMIVCEPSLYQVSEKWKIGESILLSRGEEMTGGRTRQSLLADAVEAVIAAVYFDGGLEKAREIVLRDFREIIDQAVTEGIITDFKTHLQELLQENGDVSIRYELEKFEGPPHRRKFYTKVMVEDIMMGKGEGMSKKESEQEAAKDALSKLALAEE